MKQFFTILSLTLLVFACSSDDDSSTPQQNTVTRTQVIANYANIVQQSYLDSYNGALTMQAAINAFLAAPNETTFNAAKQAWLDAREPYGQTEAYRGSNGPIDSETNEPWVIGNEGQINAWPLEEALIDYVLPETGSQGGGSFTINNISNNNIISDESIAINQSTIIDFNEFENNEAAISTGWHAIEFLLWGQDNSNPADNTPGLREFTDYTTRAGAARRAEYLRVATELLITDLNDLVETWRPGGTYRNVFEALDEEVALQQLITGPFFIAGDELSSERMIAPVGSTGGLNGWGQEDEHSCFSDNTHRDILTNALGVDNVVFGRYSNINGASFFDLVSQANPEQAQRLLDASSEARRLVAVINTAAINGEAFDLLITRESPEDVDRGPVLQAVAALQVYGDEISAAASSIGINLN